MTAGLRDTFASCPRCGIALDPRGDRWVCTQCDGTLVAEATVSQLIADMIGNRVKTIGSREEMIEPVPRPLPLLVGVANERLGCPCCAGEMETRLLHEVAVDRCAAHGLWFDRDELATMLAHAHAV